MKGPAATTAVSAIAYGSNTASITIDGKEYDVPLECYSEQNVQTIAGLIATGVASGERVGILEQIIDVMYSCGMAWDEACPPDQAGVHPGNRSTFGVSGTDSQHLGFQILTVGWSWTKCKDATAIQAPPAPLNSAASTYNDMLADMSDGLIPPLKPIRCLTIAGGHTNVFLRQCNAMVRCISGDSPLPPGVINL